MNKSLLDPYSAELLLRARQGYTQRMLQLYLQRSKSLRVSQPAISRWLSKNDVYLLPNLAPDEAFVHYQSLAQLCLVSHRYRRVLARWSGHISYMRSRGASLPEIQEDLRRRGVVVSTKSIHRELKLRAE